MAWTKMDGDIWVNTSNRTTWTKMSGDIWVSNTGKTVTKMPGGIVVTSGGDDIDFPGDF